MHLYTVVRVKAETAEEAVAIVEGLLEDDTYDGCPFDYFVRTATAISQRVKTEEDFQKGRQCEIESYEHDLQEALQLPDDDPSKAWMLKMAGESLDPFDWNSTGREVYDYATDRQDDDEPGRIWFVETDRHF